MDPKLRELQKLQEVVETLRGPQGCPWDRAQTLDDMARYIQEEASEVADAVDEARGAPAPAVCEELGDLLMNIFLAAVIAEERQGFSLAEVARGIREKLVRRHPHVFGDARASSVEDVLQRWGEIKAEEASRGGKEAAGAGSLLDGVARSLPPLARAYELARRVSRCGFDWPEAAGALEKLREEIAEVEVLVAAEAGLEGSPASRQQALEEELGDVLFSAVNVCRKLDVHPDRALRVALRKFTERFRHIEAQIEDLEAAGLDDMQVIWDRMKDRP